ncbi:1-acyl-sn-glycerol-3-phosphate acyltransferase [Chloroflexi bacterium TSY]|nr:1-acyl-sn-glycerol-3-phosphate acyltransferase [Chloroflexi bacterium TSY]
MRKIQEIAINILRHWLLSFGRIISRVLFQVQIVGEENIPKTKEPLIVISNHFSWFDPHLLAIFLPMRPVFLVATESQRKWSIRLFMRFFHLIPIWRGRVDRNAIRNALDVLEQGGVVGIFPEGGIDPKNAARVSRGEAIIDDEENEDAYGFTSRHSAQLARPRSGTAFLAVQTNARILPVGLMGTEKIVGETLRWRRLFTFWRRPSITVRIGPAFGPVQIDPELRGRERRERLNLLADQIMERIAQLFPPENRGPYRIQGDLGTGFGN